MKNIFLTFLILSVFLNAHSQSGVLKVRQFGFVCHQQTADDILGMDGISDEVKLFNYAFVNTGNNTIAPVRGGGGNFIYGEKTVAMKDWDIRKKAGTASVNGGIKTGDRENFNFVSYIIDQFIGSDDVVCIAPSIWEYDHTSAFTFPSIEFINKTKSTLGSIFLQQQVRSSLAGFNYSGIDNYNFLVAGSNIGLDNQYANVFKPFAGLQHTRPIGMKPNNEFSSIVMVLNSKLAALLANKDYGYGQGVVPIFYSDVSLGNNVTHGVYSILLKVEFTADPAVPAPAPASASTPPPLPPVPKYTKQQPVINTFPKQSVNTIKFNIAGKWVGTYGNGENNSTSFYSFQLNADGTMQLLNESGNVIANGTYTFTNNIVTGNYNYNKGSGFSFTGTVINNTITGTWGSGNNVSGDGKWMMTKN